MSTSEPDSRPVRVAVTDGASWAVAAKALEEGLHGLEPGPGRQYLGFLYVTDALAEDYGSIVSYLRQKTGVHHWIGSVGMGVMAVAPDGAGDWAGREWFGRPGACAMVADFPRDGFCVLPRLGRGVDEIGDETRHWMAARTPPFGIVHGDPMNGAVPGLVEALAREMENAQLEVPGFLVGGLTSSMGAHYQLADEVIGGGLSG
ncbi:MAG: FIST N-terminal domain-containing protein, partial [Rhodospirillaceae bacterium]